MRRLVALGLIVLGGCTYDYSALTGRQVDGSSMRGTAGTTTDDAGAKDGTLGTDATAAGGRGGQAGSVVGGASGTGGVPGRSNGSGCTTDGQCSSEHCVKAHSSDAAGICCDGLPGECTSCVNGYVVPMNDGTMIGCQACQNGATVPATGVVSSSGTSMVGIAGAPYMEPASGSCARATWKIAATFLCDTAGCAGSPSQAPSTAIDGDLTTRYSTGRPQGSQGQESLSITFPASISATGVWLYADAQDDGPAMYRVEYSTDGLTFQAFTPDVTGAGTRNLSIPFPAATTMQALRITQTGSKLVSWWSVVELDLFDCQPK